MHIRSFLGHLGLFEHFQIFQDLTFKIDFEAFETVGLLTFETFLFKVQISESFVSSSCVRHELANSCKIMIISLLRRNRMREVFMSSI